MDVDDDPLWKRIVMNEILWVILAVVTILALAFTFATSAPSEEKHLTPPQRTR